MESMTSNPNRFAAWFNMTYQGAHRRITTEDVEDMKACELIHRYGCYLRSLDGITVMGILKYEQMREKRSAQRATDEKPESASCRMCGQTIPTEPGGKTGRPREYCSDCEPVRNKARQKKLRHLRRRQATVATS